MRFLVVTHVEHSRKDGNYFGYGPYTREMNLWGDHVDEMVVIAPLTSDFPGSIEMAYTNEQLEFVHIPAFSFINLKEVVRSLFVVPVVLFRLFRQMRKADHIHLRCPGNVGLLGCLAQVFFPMKPKTAKYAGNWDPNAKQPLSYRLQKWILSNTFLTRNMQVLVYGQWEGQSKNIKPFFTASYWEADLENAREKRNDDLVKMIFVGTLSPGKRPEYALELVNAIRKEFPVKLEFFGEGPQRSIIEERIKELNLADSVSLHGNVEAERVIKACQDAHFLILPSRSEGWPKALAEAMCWGCIPVATAISCVPWMLGNGDRGVLLSMDKEGDSEHLIQLWKDRDEREQISERGEKWSRQYTLDKFEKEISKLLDESTSTDR